MHTRNNPFVFLLQNAQLSDQRLQSESTKADLDGAARRSDAALARMGLRVLNTSPCPLYSIQGV